MVRGSHVGHNYAASSAFLGASARSKGNSRAPVLLKIDRIYFWTTLAFCLKFWQPSTTGFDVSVSVNFLTTAHTRGTQNFDTLKLGQGSPFGDVVNKSLPVACVKLLFGNLCMLHFFFLRPPTILEGRPIQIHSRCFNELRCVMYVVLAQAVFFI